MTNTNATNFRKNAFEYFDKAINFGDVVRVSTKDGCAVVLSEDDYNSFMETIYLMSSPKTLREIKEGMETDLNDCLSEDEVDF